MDVKVASPSRNNAHLVKNYKFAFYIITSNRDSTKNTEVETILVC